MSGGNRFVGTIVAFVFSSGVALAQESIANWPAPPYWSPPVSRPVKDAGSGHQTMAVTALPTPPLPFIAVTPCRVIDTRNANGPFGGPALAANVSRTFNIPSGPCPGIPSTAGAYSVNIGAILPGADGFLTVFPTGTTQPVVSSVNFLGGEVIANAAIVPAGTGGSIDVFVNVPTNMYLDINGYYVAGGVVTTLNSLSGDVTLAPGSNVTITPSGQTLTVASTATGLPAGTSGQTLRHNGTNWVASSALTNDGTNVSLTGTLGFPSSARATITGGGIIPGGQVLLANAVDNNTFLGAHAGEAATPGIANAGFGFNALRNTGGSSGGNVAVGAGALVSNTGGDNNVAVGSLALETNLSGNSNVAIGVNALASVGTGSGNIAIGSDVGTILTSGSNNLYIGSANAGNESGQIRIGNNAVHTQGTVIASIYNFGAVAGAPVYVTSGGRLGTITASSRRYKEEIRDIAAESDALLALRPVAFRYREEFDPARQPQYGLIAEEVVEAFPELVVCDREGRPEGVRYQELSALLLNEIQKQHRNIQSQQAEIDTLRAELAKLQAQLAGTGAVRQ